MFPVKDSKIIKVRIQYSARSKQKFEYDSIDIFHAF